MDACSNKEDTVQDQGDSVKASRWGDISHATETAGVYSPGTEGQVSGQEMTTRGDIKSKALAWCRQGIKY